MCVLSQTLGWGGHDDRPSSFLMPADSIPALSLGSVVLIVFLGCVGFVLLRGMARMILGTLILGLSGWVAFRLWQLAPELSVQWTGKSVVWLIQALPIAGFFLAWFLLRKLLRLFTTGGVKSAKALWPSSLMGFLFRLVLALIPTAGICLVVLLTLHHRGSVAEIRAYAGPKSQAPASYAQQLKTAIDEILPSSWLLSLDPLADPARVALAKLISAQAVTPLSPVMDPQTGKPIPRAILVDDPDLQTLAREGNFSTLLRHPLLTKALADPKIQKLLHDLQH
jgi:hypothetical protein